MTTNTTIVRDALGRFVSPKLAKAPAKKSVKTTKPAPKPAPKSTTKTTKPAKK